MTNDEKKVLIDKWAPMVDQPNRNGRSYSSELIAQLLENQTLLNKKILFEDILV